MVLNNLYKLYWGPYSASEQVYLVFGYLSGQISRDMGIANLSNVSSYAIGTKSVFSTAVPDERDKLDFAITSTPQQEVNVVGIGFNKADGNLELIALSFIKDNLGIKSLSITGIHQLFADIRVVFSIEPSQGVYNLYYTENAPRIKYLYDNIRLDYHRIGFAHSSDMIPHTYQTLSVSDSTTIPSFTYIPAVTSLATYLIKPYAGMCGYSDTAMISYAQVYNVTGAFVVNPPLYWGSLIFLPIQNGIMLGYAYHNSVDVVQHDSSGNSTTTTTSIVSNDNIRGLSCAGRNNGHNYNGTATTYNYFGVPANDDNVYFSQPTQLNDITLCSFTQNFNMTAFNQGTQVYSGPAIAQYRYGSMYMISLCTQETGGYTLVWSVSEKQANGQQYFQILVLNNSGFQVLATINTPLTADTSYTIQGMWAYNQALSWIGTNTDGYTYIHSYDVTVNSASSISIAYRSGKQFSNVSRIHVTDHCCNVMTSSYSTFGIYWTANNYAEYSFSQSGTLQLTGGQLWQLDNALYMRRFNNGNQQLVLSNVGSDSYPVCINQWLASYAQFRHYDNSSSELISLATQGTNNPVFLSYGQSIENSPRSGSGVYEVNSIGRYDSDGFFAVHTVRYTSTNNLPGMRVRGNIRRCQSGLQTSRTGQALCTTRAFIYRGFFISQSTGHVRICYIMPPSMRPVAAFNFTADEVRRGTILDSDFLGTNINCYKAGKIFYSTPQTTSITIPGTRDYATCLFGGIVEEVYSNLTVYGDTKPMNVNISTGLGQLALPED